MINLEQVFSPDVFRNQAHQLVDTLADYLENIQKPNTHQAIPYQQIAWPCGKPTLMLGLAIIRLSFSKK
jgi:hypothetical protein